MTIVRSELAARSLRRLPRRVPCDVDVAVTFRAHRGAMSTITLVLRSVANPNPPRPDHESRSRVSRRSDHPSAWSRDRSEHFSAGRTCVPHWAVTRDGGTPAAADRASGAGALVGHGVATIPALQNRPVPSVVMSLLGELDVQIEVDRVGDRRVRTAGEQTGDACTGVNDDAADLNV